MLVLLVGFSAQPAAAQQKYVGTFDLLTEAYWGPTLLPTGHYTLSLNPEAGKPVRVVSITGEGVRAFLLAGPGNPDRVSNKGELRLENYNGVYVVRHLDAGLLGQSYSFPVSKKVHERVEQAASAPATVTLPVAASAATE